MTNSELTLVLGGTGKTGRRVAQRLRALDRPVRIGSRAGDPPFDWTDRATWPGVAGRCARGVPDLSAGPRLPRRGRHRRRVRGARRRERGAAAGAAVRPRRGRRAGRREGGRSRRRGVGGRPVRVLHAELHRGLPGRRGRGGRDRAAGRRRAGAVRRRRRHRRGRGRRTARPDPAGPGVRGDRTAGAHLRAGRGGDLGRDRPTGAVPPGRRGRVRRRRGRGRVPARGRGRAR